MTRKQKPSLTLSEFLDNEENQMVVLEKIINMLRKNEEWGRHGLFAKIAEQTDFSQAYVGRVLTGKQPLRENFVEKIAGYLGVSVHWLRGEDDKEQKTKIFFDEKLARKLFNLMEDYCSQNKLSQENKSSLFLKIYIYFNSNEKKPTTKSEVEQLLKEFQEGL